MRIQAYQFIKYDQFTTLHHIERVHHTGAVVCFDFEDGIVDPLNPNASASLKSACRACFIHICSLLAKSALKVKVGVRLNRFNSAEFEKDLESVKGLEFEAVFLPKIEEPEELDLIVKRLKENKITFRHLIPVIESRKGLDNLPQIIRSNALIAHFAFGHCDYNLNNQVFPFFHQDSKEYWKWTNALLAGIDLQKITFINSPYLFIHQDHFFCAMLDQLFLITKGNAGQITLTTPQSALCKARPLSAGNFLSLLENKNKVAVGKHIARQLVSEFEACNKSRGLSRNSDRLFSLQEYSAAKANLNDPREVAEICFAGGCFPVQHDIVHEDLYHQRLRRKLEQTGIHKWNVNILRYERFTSLADKIDSLSRLKHLDLLVFHIRPEPYLRLVKFYYKYMDDKGKIRGSFNLPYFKILMPEKFDLLTLERSFPLNAKPLSSRFHKFLVSCNYFLGKIIGNQKYALKSYLDLTRKIHELCVQKNIRLIVQGPNLRHNAPLEPLLCRDLNTYISRHMPDSDYLDMLHMETKSGFSYTKKNGIHVTPEYHVLVADQLYRHINNHAGF